MSNSSTTPTDAIALRRTISVDNSSNVVVIKESNIDYYEIKENNSSQRILTIRRK